MLHVGGVRTALYNYLFARQRDGEFLLRIENTDTGREVTEAVAQIQASLIDLGLDWDGEVSYQTDRFERCRELAARLVADGKAYEEHDPEKGTAIRFRVPAGETCWVDAVKGELRFPNADIKDFVILRADGTPLYNFASPVDDALDGITHVIRGDDHVSNTPKQIMLLEALGYEPPVYAHIPMVAGPDGKKLSKRHGAVGLQEFLSEGYLPQTLVNFLALIGWAPGEGETQEIFTLDELVERFDLAHVGEAMGRFDYDKLRWLNGQYLRSLADYEFAGQLTSYLWEQGYRYDLALTTQVAALVQEKIATFAEFPKLAGYFFSRPKPALDLLDGGLLAIFKEALAAIDCEDWRADAIGEALKSGCELAGVKPRNGLRVLYGAVCGSPFGASIFHSLELLGRNESLIRVEQALALCSDRQALLARIAADVAVLQHDAQAMAKLLAE